MSKIRSRHELGIQLPPTNVQGTGGEDLTKEGEIAVDSSDSKLKVRLEDSTQSVVTEDQTQELVNKTIDADSNIIENLEVDNLKAGVLNTSTSLDSASDTQIPSAKATKDYVDNAAGTVQVDVDDLITLSGVPANSTDLGTFTGTVIPDNSTNKEALQALETSVDAHSSAIMDLSEEIQDLAVLSGVPIDSTDLGTFTGTTIPDNSTIKGALQSLETSVETKASESDLEDHVNTSSEVHGVTGNVVGTTDTQTLTNKTLTSPTISGGSLTNALVVTPSQSDVKQDTFTNLVTYASTATNGQLVFATDNKKMYQVIDGALSDVGGGGQTLDTIFQLTADESISDWTNITSDFSISKVDPLFGDASYVLEMNDLSAATHKLIPVDEGFRGGLVALTFSYIMPDGAARVALLDQNNDLIDGARFDVPSANGKEKFGTTVFIPNYVTGVRFQAEARDTVAGGSFKFDNVQLSSDVLGVIDYSTVPVGTIIESMLTEAQIQAQSGAGIILADGRDVTGSRYHAITGNTTVPDLRGVFLRGKNNGRDDGNENPDGEKDLGEFTGDAIRNITGTFYVASGSPSGVFSQSGGAQSGAWGSGSSRYAINLNASTQVPTALDNRPKNVTVNYFIKINDTNLSIVAPTDQVTEKTIAFRWRSPAEATEANLSATGQVGDYVTGQYAANTNTLTQCTTRPTQTDADMSVNGFQIFTRAYNAASTAALPARFVIKIAEPNQMSVCDLAVYKDVTRLISGNLDWNSPSSTADIGVRTKSFNPSTGLLTVDAGLREGTTTSAALDFADTTVQTNGYITFTASKLAQGVAIPTPARYVVKTYQSGTSWYEVYSDGWVRQGSYVIGGGAITTTTVTWLIPMRDTNYSLVSGLNSSSDNSGIAMRGFGWVSKTTTNAVMYVASNTGKTNVVEGYGDSATVKSHGATPNY